MKDWSCVDDNPRNAKLYAMLHIIAVWAIAPYMTERRKRRARRRRMVTEIGRCKSADRYTIQASLDR